MGSGPPSKHPIRQEVMRCLTVRSPSDLSRSCSGWKLETFPKRSAGGEVPLVGQDWDPVEEFHTHSPSGGLTLG